MVVVYPYPVAFLADRLKIASVEWDIQRSDELSGSGDGRVWQAELAPPLWRANVRLATVYHNEAKQIAALVRKLHGAQESFFLFDPLSTYPQADPTGAVVGSSNVQVNSVPAGRRTLTLKGLPAGYTLTIGDKLQITYSSNPTRYAFLEASETVAADGSGTTGAFEVFPHVPTGIGANDAVTLAKPACLGFVVPGSFSPGSSYGTADLKLTEGMSFTFLERRR